MHEKQKKQVKERAEEIVKLNNKEGVPARYLVVPEGTELENTEAKEKFKAEHVVDILKEKLDT